MFSTYVFKINFLTSLGMLFQLSIIPVLKKFRRISVRGFFLQGMVRIGSTARVGTGPGSIISRGKKKKKGKTEKWKIGKNKDDECPVEV